MTRTHRVIALIVPIVVAASDGVAQTPGASPQATQEVTRG